MQPGHSLVRQIASQLISPPNSLFFIKGANGWSNWQIGVIVGSVIVIVASLIGIVFMFLPSRRRRPSPTGSNRIFRLPHQVRRVRSGGRIDEWAIDELESLGEFEVVDPSTSRHQRADHIRHPSASSLYNDFSDSAALTSDTTLSHAPKRGIWFTLRSTVQGWNPFRVQPVPVVSTPRFNDFRLSVAPNDSGHVRLASTATLFDEQSDTLRNSTGGVLNKIRDKTPWTGNWTNPLRRKPVTVKPIEPREGFRIDDSDPNSPNALSGGRRMANMWEDEGNAQPDAVMVSTDDLQAGDAQGQEYTGVDRGEGERIDERVHLISPQLGAEFIQDPRQEYNSVMPSSLTTHDVRVFLFCLSTPSLNGPCIQSSPEILGDSHEDSQFLSENSPLSTENIEIEHNDPTPRSSPTDRFHPELANTGVAGHTAQSESSFPSAAADSPRDPFRVFVRPSRSDPTLLFPGAVRAAGYFGIPDSRANRDGI
jgi:hypothetical protein